jgi:hypothetical protein
VCIGDKGNPALARSAPSALHGETILVARQALGLAIRIRSTVSRIRQDAVDAGVGGPAPVDIAPDRAGRDRQIVFREPQQGLPGTAEFEELCKHQLDRAPNALVGFLLKSPVLVLDETDRTVRHEFTASRLLDSGLAGPLPKQVEFVLVEGSLQPQQQPIIAQARRIHRLLIDEQCVDNTAHLDQLLPLAAVPREARNLACANRTHLPETDLRHHALKSSARDIAARRTAEIFINDLHFAPAQGS